MDRGRDVRPALDRWREAKQALDEATPWTAEWQRLRLVEGERRLTSLRLSDSQTHRFTVTANDDGKDWVARVKGDRELVTTAHRFDEALRMLRELIATVEDLDPRSIKLDVEFDTPRVGAEAPRSSRR